jgi:hypothetical protein
MADSNANNNKIGLPTVSIIPDALKYYDANTDRFMKIRKKIKYYSDSESKSANNSDTISSDAINTDHVEYSFYDKDKIFLFKSRIEIVGKYYEGASIWFWGWALPSINKSASTTIRNVFIYGTDINVINNGIVDDEKLLLKNELITSRSIITDLIQIDIHCALASYLAKKPFILPFNFGDINKIRYKEFNDYLTDDINDDTSDDKSAEDRNRVIYFMYILDHPGV